MAKNNKNNYKAKAEVKEEKKYVNPVTKPAGKILITILALAMCFAGLASVIYLLVKAILKV